MPYIRIELAGQKTFGGFLTIDGGSEWGVSDGQLIPVTPGTHYLSFSSINSLRRGVIKFNAKVGNYSQAYNADKDTVSGNITESFGDTTVMNFVVVSDGGGHILDLPTYTMHTLDEEEYAQVEAEYKAYMAARKKEREEREAAEAAEDAKHNPTVALLLCLFLGFLGAHKFYQGKKGMGVLYICTMGLFGIGVMVDLFKLILRVLARKKS